MLRGQFDFSWKKYNPASPPLKETNLLFYAAPQTPGFCEDISSLNCFPLCQVPFFSLSLSPPTSLSSHIISRLGETVCESSFTTENLARKSIFPLLFQALTGQRERDRSASVLSFRLHLSLSLRVFAVISFHRFLVMCRFIPFCFGLLLFFPSHFACPHIDRNATVRAVYCPKKADLTDARAFPHQLPPHGCVHQVTNVHRGDDVSGSSQGGDEGFGGISAAHMVPGPLPVSIHHYLI